MPTLEKVLWATLIAWGAALLGLAAASLLLGVPPRHVDYLVLTALVSLGVVTLLALAGPPELRGELRRLRVLAVVLPSAFIAAVELGLYLLATYGVIAEPAQHVLATVILSAGAVPLSLYVFHNFARLRTELAEQAQLLATVEERERIARDLHDDLGQLLAFLSTKVQAIQELMATGRSSRAEEELAGLEKSIRALGTQVREAILGLRVQMSPGRPLGEALREYSMDFGVLAGLDVTFDGRADAGRGLSGPQQYQLLRIVQEALSNVRRHARARRIRVRVEERRGCLEVSVADDGKAFLPAAVSTGFGLKTMAERAANLHGTLEIESAEGSGTTVRVRVPVEGA